MALRVVADLNAAQWAQLMEAMKRGPTKKQIEIAKWAREEFKDIKIKNVDY